MRQPSSVPARGFGMASHHMPLQTHLFVLAVSALRYWRQHFEGLHTQWDGRLQSLRRLVQTPT